MMYITKSLFVEWMTNPKLAWWHVHSKKDIYLVINDYLYGDMDGMAMGQAAEDQVLALFDEGTVHHINTDNMRKNWHQTYHDRTMKVMESAVGPVYQPAFLFEDVFVKCDFLIPDGTGRFDLLEVKAKNTIWKQTKDAPLLDELGVDVSIQAWTLRQILGERFSGKCFLAYLNKEYRLQGAIDPHSLILMDDVSDECLDAKKILVQLDLMREHLALDEASFNNIYPYKGDDYMLYYGTTAPQGSIWSMGCLRSKTQVLAEHHISNMDDIDDSVMDLLLKKNGEMGSVYHFVDLWRRGQTMIEHENIKERLGSLTFPLYFYDYETIKWPVPLLQGTGPWQQVVVQYSLHKLDADGTMTHKEFLLAPGAHDNKVLVEHLIADLDDAQGGSFIVWYQGFENSRNEEMAKMYPIFHDALMRINASTFDLMEIFKEHLYFDRGFWGSCSIKKVLPVLTDINYEDLNVANGAVASELLMKMLRNELNPYELAQAKQDLLAYCKLDTWAMVEIYRALLACTEGRE